MENSIDKCVGCYKNKVRRQCHHCKQTIYCSIRCRQNDWLVHNPNCGQAEIVIVPTVVRNKKLMLLLTGLSYCWNHLGAEHILCIVRHVGYPPNEEQYYECMVQLRPGAGNEGRLMIDGREPNAEWLNICIHYVTPADELTKFHLMFDVDYCEIISATTRQLLPVDQIDPEKGFMIYASDKDYFCVAMLDGIVYQI